MANHVMTPRLCPFPSFHELPRITQEMEWRREEKTPVAAVWCGIQTEKTQKQMEKKGVEWLNYLSS